MKYNFYPFTYSGQKWVYKNRCVIKVEHKLPQDISPDIRKRMFKIINESWLCGYVVLPKTSVPSDWWGNYNAPGLNSLAIHGNLTYCELEGVPDQDKYQAQYIKSLDEMYKNAKKNRDLKNTFKYMNQRQKLKEEYIANLSKTSEGFVVFGFDCNHFEDSENPSLKDVNHVMMLTEQMEQQLLLFAKRYEEYKNADKVPVTTDIVRKTIMREIRAQAELKTKMGLGGMIDILSGKTPEDDLLYL